MADGPRLAPHQGVHRVTTSCLCVVLVSLGIASDARAEPDLRWGLTASTRIESFENPLDSIGPLFFAQLSLDRQIAGDERRAWHASARLALGASWERSARGGDLLVGPTIRLPTRGTMTLHASLRGGFGAASVDQLHDEEHLSRASLVLEPSLILSLSRRLSMHVGATTRNAVFQRTDLMRGPPETTWSLWRPEYGAQLGVQARF